MKKAFIAAPLLGTFIFLASIAFVVNLSNTEKLASSQVINDAYHNRLVSLLEVYRTDLASIFREGIIRTTEYFLLRQGWNEFDLNQNPAWITGGGAGSCVVAIVGPGAPTNCSSNTDPTACGHQADCTWIGQGDPDQDGNGKVSFEELRFVKCDNIRILTSQIICSLPQTVSAVGAPLSYAYGLPQWMSKLNTTLPFEGMKFDVANRDVMAVFLPKVDLSDPALREASIQAYQDHCLAMMKGSVFDCNNFAKNEAVPYRCCKQVTTWDAPCTDVVPGCEDGTFYLNVSLNNSVVYPAMPRLNASDAKGNQIRSGAIGESDFLLPINYPLFRYYNYAFGVYKELAYGKQGPSNPTEGEFEGVVDGLCRGGSDCDNILIDGVTNYAGDNYGAMGSAPDVKADVEEKLFGRYTDSCNDYSSLDGLDYASLGVTAPMGSKLFGGNVTLYSSTDGGTTDYSPCASILNRVDDLGEEPATVLGGSQMNSVDYHCGAGGLDEYCAYYASLNLKFEFKDGNPAYQVDPENQNFFRWSASPEYVP